MTQARKKRTTLLLSATGLITMVAAVASISADDPGGVAVRAGMVLMAAGAGMWLSWRLLVPAILLVWLLPNYLRSVIDGAGLGSIHMLLELPGLAGIVIFALVARESLRKLEREDLRLGSQDDLAGLDPATGLFDARQLRPALASELARSRRFGHTFSLVLVGIDEMRQKYDYRDAATWRSSLAATSRLLRQTRLNVDRVFHYKEGAFALILPESTGKDIFGLVKRLRRLARSMTPAESEPGGPLPVHFGATFYPECATTVEDLIRRAEIALRVASSSTTRYQLDTAEAVELPPAQSLRRENIQAAVAPPSSEDLNMPREASAYTAGASEDTDSRQAHPPRLLAPTSDVSEEFEALLTQMNETLSMIRAVRDRAA